MATQARLLPRSRIAWLVAGLLCALTGCLGARDRTGEADTERARDRAARDLVELEQRALLPISSADPDLWAGGRGRNPVRLRRLSAPDPRDERTLLLLADPGELRLYDSSWTLRASLAVLPGSASWAFVDETDLFVASPLTSRVARVRIDPDVLRAAGEVDFRLSADAPDSALGVLGIQDLAFDAQSRTLFAIDSVRDRLLCLRVDPADESSSAVRWSVPTTAGPLRLAVGGRFLIVAGLLGHAIEVRSLQSLPPPVIAQARHDGPIWSIAALANGDSLWIAAGGIEDRPLDRTGGEFGFVDSFLFLYRCLGDRLERIDSFNLSAIGVVTPKWLAFELGSNDRVLWVSGYGGERVAAFRASARGVHLTGTWEAPPGVAHGDFERGKATAGPDPSAILAASPLLDVIVRIGVESSPASRPAADPLLRFDDLARPFADRLGEILLYTDLLAPENETAGSLSRFSCEACHFEGAIDGRTHFTGREEVHATTKPLFGLLDNIPLFSRATTPDLASMVPAEFGVANQHRHDWQRIARQDHAWLEWIEAPDVIVPESQRRALLAFLARWESPPRPERYVHEPFAPVERRGLEVFRDRCAGCHRPLRTTRDESASVPFSDWERVLTGEESEGEGIIWGAPFRAKTGVEPYPAPEGARVPSLRRALWKRPYFTNGSAPDLGAVLREYRYRGARAWHAQGPEGADSLRGDEIRALRRVLERF